EKNGDEKVVCQGESVSRGQVRDDATGKFERGDDQSGVPHQGRTPGRLQIQRGGRAAARRGRYPQQPALAFCPGDRSKAAGPVGRSRGLLGYALPASRTARVSEPG